MNFRTLFILTLVLSLCGCSGTKTADPTPSPTPTVAGPGGSTSTQATPGPAHLDLVPFKITVKATQGDETMEMAFTGDAEGLITLESDGRKETAQLHPDGRFEAENQPISLMLAPNGTVMVGGKPSPVQIAEDGTVSARGKQMFKRDGNTLVDINPENPNEKVFSREGMNVVIDADAKANRAISFLMSIMIMNVNSGGSAPPPSAPPAPQATP